LKKSYRDEYLATQVKGGIAYQIQALRAKAHLSQSEFGEKIGKPQSVVSRLESTEYGSLNVRTLLDVAAGMDVALLIRFVSYPEFFKWTERMSEADLSVETIYESDARITSGALTLRVPLATDASRALTASYHNQAGITYAQ
jgi:transcriptional regulator with XRE-family HTH domain